MDAYADTQQIMVKQIQAERRAQAAAERLAAQGARPPAPARAQGLALKLARRLVTIALVS